ncbi:MAG: S8 family serine peptidase [Chloroflexi bacterium]|nr:S8 family serine peptidase [Chloroflexota bacterium]
MCHQLLDQGLGIQGGAPQFLEPDLAQTWLVGPPAEAGLALTQPCEVAAPQDTRFPAGPAPLWFQDAVHGQFADAVAALGSVDRVSAARVAHCDTGYDPSHIALPEFLNRTLQRNFVDSDRPDDASDKSTGIGANLGHGTGTIGVLAGRATPGLAAIGAAPFLEVVPLRVANSVVLFHNSAIASAFLHVRDLCADPSTRVDVITMSMGGLASATWADAVNALYEAGVFVVTAAGNNIDNLPTRNIVFPARFNRVVAACGVMANDTAYADLTSGLMAGNYGPTSKMRTALAAYTPNAPWARFGCDETIDLNGAGTSCATPQIAAAAAIWIQQNRSKLDQYSAPWMRVEAVRKALFDSAHPSDQTRLGRGEVRTHDALNQQPASESQLRAEAPDSASFSFLRVLLGVGLAATDTRQQMLELEALQLSQSARIEQILPDPGVDPASLPRDDLERLREALIEHPNASQTLRTALGAASRPPLVPVPSPVQPLTAVERLHLAHATSPQPPRPTRRRLRVYAYDPSLGTQLETLGINQAVLDVIWEDGLQPGPVGEYLEIVDVDPSSQCCYAPVDLNDSSLLVADGLNPQESNPQFQQQMVYAVAMRTIEHFERALGRRALWSPRLVTVDGHTQEQYVQRLRIYPHALRAANAYYSPTQRALLMGYFFASADDAPSVVPGGTVFTALSSDIVAHESTHALLDGLHRRFLEPTNPDVLAFHEAFADIVALFQHFSIPGALKQAINTTRGDLSMDNTLVELAVQFGQAIGKYAGLRNAIGSFDKSTNHFTHKTPSTTDYTSTTEPHDLGSVLVAAVFDAFLQIYRSRGADLIRLATRGSGILPRGAISVDLVERLADEAVKAAAHVLDICVRALDYCPPVDITFGEYLRALITADRDLVPEDQRGYRVAFVSAFRSRGIYAANVKSLSVDSLAWEPPPLPLRNTARVLEQLSLDWDLMSDRRQAYTSSRHNAFLLHQWLHDSTQVSDEELDVLGLSRAPGARQIGNVAGTLHPIEVHSVRPCRRVGPDGQLQSDVVIEITQSFHPDTGPGGVFRGGCTLLVDLRQKQVRYTVLKRVDQQVRFEKQQAFAQLRLDPLHASYFTRSDDDAEPFALLHRAF